jgi:hypothetical protein
LIYHPIEMPPAIRRLAAVLELRPYEEGEELSGWGAAGLTWIIAPTALEVDMKTDFAPRVNVIIDVFYSIASTATKEPENR